MKKGAAFLPIVLEKQVEQAKRCPKCESTMTVYFTVQAWYECCSKECKHYIVIEKQEPPFVVGGQNYDTKE